MNASGPLLTAVDSRKRGGAQGEHLVVSSLKPAPSFPRRGWTHVGDL